MMATTFNTQKKLDLPPRGDRNADPITDEPGSHPIETGIGAAAAGASAGLAAGALGGPLAAVVGVTAGAVAGGIIGKHVGEIIDPTSVDEFLRENFESRPYVKAGDSYEDFRAAYRYGGLAESKYGDCGLDLADINLRKEWENKGNEMAWDRASGAIKDGYERAVELRKANESCCTDDSCD
jgi:hypothetical protein